MTGNEALAYGLIAAGIRFGAAYPITPWSEVMEILRRELLEIRAPEDIRPMRKMRIGLGLHGDWR